MLLIIKKMIRVKSDIFAVERATKQRNNLLRRDFNTLNHLILTGGGRSRQTTPKRKSPSKNDWASYAGDGLRWTGNKVYDAGVWGRERIKNATVGSGKWLYKKANDMAVKRACAICGKHSVTDGEVDDILNVLRSIYQTVIKEMKKVKKIKQKLNKPVAPVDRKLLLKELND